MNQFNQKTLVIVKPDGMRRHLIGEIIKRLEQVGLDLVDAKYTQANEQLARDHYPVTDEWLEAVGGKSLGDYQKYGLDPMATLGTADPKEIGRMIHQFNIKYLMSGPVLAMVWEGNHAIEIVRKLVGSTVASVALPGTIRGDFAIDSAIAANAEKRSIQNLVHASGSIEEAAREIELWFGD
ncbi:nucleoside-diphosphate kinase [Candidatus Daviesbacteria bacterium RIFCSPHIGHO2_01_FULL_44_29]|uniref:nucleoside-diphosphate kinase n=1 Tax=Candidatus Daviesbacteria bacterium RIFCSPHIGHO2_02_FULL_43_12 TaxID=1797776 RepID=A0A1F5KIF5_9BACT|nr:MAG: nucleoside-diphosphate kinase [Candidatus Daviesbacteria bacterium RIFCSPHIGHO2_01_FULL_44_29]OGE40423.1 MAG: nucleoside-diphosphate kinase [Candidatus Daviesbacteria bacterium RIFCSPHIGHO2_12_FULL_47_45]OGE40733.1 MAG: nucleoside-diphosphate kinase [Candidatus Daviesbacteria bacterium RIFCSPHIGHO2_02_FULL_43_12]OGE69770.1 MAG: nucleoside-diphosphate kinase [Candidatus Daviesbacteria bacterium RIFCSPLOWO2_01_FULL_43_15]